MRGLGPALARAVRWLGGWLTHCWLWVVGWLVLGIGGWLLGLVDVWTARGLASIALMPGVVGAVWVGLAPSSFELLAAGPWRGCVGSGSSGATGRASAVTHIWPSGGPRRGAGRTAPLRLLSGGYVLGCGGSARHGMRCR